jgi:hypothetical protein
LWNKLIQDAIDEIDGMLKRKNEAIHYVYDEPIDVIQDERILRNEHCKKIYGITGRRY